MSVAYVSAGQTIRHTQLNALTGELDKALRCLFADKSPYVYSHGRTLPLGTRFYFGTSASWRIISQLFPSATTYSHTTYETAAAGFTVDSYDATTETAVTTQSDPWPLDGSLESHTTTSGGTDYFWRQDKNGAGDYGKRECYRRFAVAEILIEALGSTSWTWDSRFDRYHFIRFHNFDLTTLTITLPGGQTVSVPPLGCKAVRRIYPASSTWDTSFVYLWGARSGDWLIWDGVEANNVASLQSYHRWLDSLSGASGYASIPRNPLGDNPGFHIDPTVVWDGSSLLPQPISGTTEVFKYEKHLGRMVVYQDAAAVTPTRTVENPTWTTLAAGTGTIKLTASTGSVPHTLTLGADTGAVTPVDVFSTGSNIMRRWPATLPLTLSSSYEGVGTANPPDSRQIYGAEQETTTDTVQYITQPGFVGVDVTLSVTAAFFGSGNAYWTSTSTASIWSSLNTVATLSSGSATEQTSAPTITWKSDGWRLVACAETSIPVALAVWPCDFILDLLPKLALATVSESGFAVKCGGDVLGRDTWDITSRSYGRRISDFVGYKSGATHYYTGHPDIEGGDSDPIAGGVEMSESRVEPDAAVTTRLESIGITKDETETLPVYPTADVADRLAADDSAAAYAAARASWLANTLTDADKETLVRLPIIGMHYNHVAQRLNGITAIVPYTHEHLVWYGELEDGSYTIGYPPDFYCGVLSSGSRASTVGITVNSKTINLTTQYYVTQTDVAAWCATYGIRFFSLRFSSMCDWLSGSETLRTSYTFKEDNTQPHRDTQSFKLWLYRTVDVDDGRTVDVVSAGPGMQDPARGAMAELEHVRENGTAAPSGWALETNNYVLTWTNDVIHYDNNPLNATDLGNNEEPFSVYTADANPPAIWNASDLPQYITVDDVDALYGGTGAGTRAFYRLVLLPRFFFKRT